MILESYGERETESERDFEAAWLISRLFVLANMLNVAIRKRMEVAELESCRAVGV